MYRLNAIHIYLAHYLRKLSEKFAIKLYAKRRHKNTLEKIDESYLLDEKGRNDELRGIG